MRCRSFFLALLGLLQLAPTVVSAATPAPAAAVVSRRAEWDREAAAFFAGPIRKFELNLNREALQGLRNNPRQSQPATVRVGTNVFTSVAVQVKGAAGSTRSIDDNPALTLNFDKLKPGQRGFGLDKLHLNNSVQDPAYLDENLASWLYLSAGVPTARASHALVTLNGRFLGLYVLKEGYDHEFIRRNFTGGTNAAGNLYDGGFVQDIDAALERDAGRGVTNRSDLRRLREVLNRPLEQRRTELDRVLDVDRFLTYVSYQMFTADWDGYIRNRNNYRLYLDPSGRATFIPHGMDQLFRRPEDQVRDGWNSQVPWRVFELPELRERLRQRMTELAATAFQIPPVTQKIAAIRARIQAAMAGFPPDDRRQVEGELDQRQRAIVERIKFVQEELRHWPDPLPQLASGTVVELGEWEPLQQVGRAKFDRQPRQGGEPAALHLAVLEGEVIASYRYSVRLPMGGYRLSGRAATKNVQAFSGNLGAGVGIRISGSQRPHKLEGTTDWTPLNFDFHLPDDGEATLILELRATKGEAWFDPASLKLTKR
jgi:hypothetical protein